MNAPCKPIAKHLRSYALGLLSDRKMQRIQAHLEGCAACRDALARERASLTSLDALPAPRLPEALADRTLARIQLAQAAENATHSDAATPWKLHWRWWSALATACLVLLLLGSIAIGLTLQARHPDWLAWRPDFSVESRLFSRGASHNHLKQWGLIMRLYSGENRGRFPPVAPYDGVWAPDLKRLYPNYVNDLSIMVNPKRPDARKLRQELQTALTQEPPDWRKAAEIFAQSYTYTGWHVENPEQLAQLSDGRFKLSQAAQAAANGDREVEATVEPPLPDLDSDYRLEGAYIPRLREGVERFYITDINNPGAAHAVASNIVVMFETLDEPGGSFFPRQYGALFMDGHVSVMQLGTAFPIVPEVVEILSGSAETDMSAEEAPPHAQQAAPESNAAE